MTSLTRRTLLKGGSAVLASSFLSSSAFIEWARAWAQSSQWKPEPNAQIAFMRWKYFVQAEDEAFTALIDAFQKASGVTVNLQKESADDIQPKASVAANTGAGADVYWGYYSLPHLFPQKCLDVTDVATYLGNKYGGWAPAAETYGKSSAKWICIPYHFAGSKLNYRISAMQKAGFSKFPATTDELLEFAKATKRNGTPGGMALGHASADATAWVHWCLWAHGGNLVDKNDKIVINSPETLKALEYAKQLSQHFIPGTASWNDAFNNKAFVAGELYWTNNGISIYAAAQRDPARQDVAADMDHAAWPIGPVGQPTELHTCFPMVAMGYTKYPQATKMMLAFLLEADNYGKWLEASSGYASHPLRAYDSNPVWTSDPKRAIFRDCAFKTLTVGGQGSVGEKAAAAIAEFLLVDMFAAVCTGRDEPANAIKITERQAQRLYR